MLQIYMQSANQLYSFQQICLSKAPIRTQGLVAAAVLFAEICRVM